jgi:hypothetical protein
LCPGVHPFAAQHLDPREHRVQRRA